MSFHFMCSLYSWIDSYSPNRRLIVSVVTIGQCSKSGLCDSNLDVVCVVGSANLLITGYGDLKWSVVSVVGHVRLARPFICDSKSDVVCVVG